MSQTFYIDTNRQNASIKSSETNAEWEYKLSNVLQLPAGSEIAIQDMFIHKQGISGATIEIEEDIDETIYFSIYLSDNPHWTPKATFSEDKRENTEITGNAGYEPTFCPFGILQSMCVNNPYYTEAGSDHTTSTGTEFTVMDIEISEGVVNNAGCYYGEPAWGQRIGLFCDDGRGNPRLNGGEWNNLNDPYISGYSEYPMMAIYVDEISKYRDRADNAFNDDEERGTTGKSMNVELDDPRFKPLVKSVDIHIPKGVYSIGEIADLIDGQINGKYASVKSNDDYYTDTYIQKQNEGTFTGTLETGGIYSKVKSFDRYGQNVGQNPDANNPLVNDKAPSTDLAYVFGQTSYKAYVAGEDAPHDEVHFPLSNPSGLKEFGFAGFNCPYNLPYTVDTDYTYITYHLVDGTTASKWVDTWLIAYNELPTAGVKDGLKKYTHKEPTKMKGRKPILPTKDHIMYIPVHYYNMLVKLWKHEDTDDGYWTTTTKPAGKNAFLNATDNWTINFKRQMRYGFQTRVNAYGKSVSPVNGLDYGENGMQIGLHTKNNKNKKSDYISAEHDNLQKEESTTVGLNAVNLNYDINNTGYYVGTPDFSFSYDSDRSAFSVSGLHQECRIPSADISGNPMASEGQTAIYMRRAPTLHEDIMKNPKRTTATQSAYPPADGTHPTKPTLEEYNAKFTKEGGHEKYSQRIVNTLNANEDRVGGCAIYNWAYQTALKYGDIKPQTYTKKDYLNRDIKVYHDDYQYLWKYEDFFSTKKLAKSVWEKTLWFKLGFTFENLQDSETWESVPYYDLPVGEYTNEPEIDISNNPDSTFHDLQTSRRSNTYHQYRDNNYFKNEDFKIYGKTTKGDISVDTASSVSTTFNNLLYTYEERQQSGKGEPGKDKNNAKATPSNIHQIMRTYDNNDINKPYFGNNPQVVTSEHKIGNYKSEAATFNYGNNSLVPYLLTNAQGSSDDAYNTVYSYDNSMYVGKTRVPILTNSKMILSSKLPRLSDQGYYIITSDIVDYYQDDLKQGQPLPMIGILPISNLSNQDFISGATDIIHTTQQVKNINSIKIKILNPDLTVPSLEPNSSVIFKITIPLPQQTPLLQDKEEGENKKTGRPQPNPHDKKTESG